jgi:hypothetical protein
MDTPSADAKATRSSWRLPGSRRAAGSPTRVNPHTEALRTTERFRRVDFGHLQLSVTIDDPKAYARPWTTDTIPFDLLPDQELLEHLCENNRDLPNLMKIWGAQEGAPGR